MHSIGRKYTGKKCYITNCSFEDALRTDVFIKNNYEII